MPSFEVAIIGAGSGGIATAASLLKRLPHTRIAIIEPSADHYYQPGWTLVGGGVFDAAATRRDTASVLPAAVTWIQQHAVNVDTTKNQVRVADGSFVHYRQLVVAPGLVLDWEAIEGLAETLGRNGVTSNYRYDLAPYTWQLVQSLKGGRAVFTQPAMPIKCAGAPQKALYLSCSSWLRNNVLQNINVQFYNSGAVLFGVPDYVPALQSYIDKYRVQVNFSHNLVKVDGERKKAWFVRSSEAGQEEVETDFDMLHVCPPQHAPALLRDSGLADDAGWLAVDPNSLQHHHHPNIWGVGDVLNTSNAKTMAAARQQAVVVAKNLTSALQGNRPAARYYGYGSCPLTVEHGKIVLAEFSYGGKVTPTFPEWLNDGRKPTRLAWFLKQTLLPPLYWHGMLKGREWLTRPFKVA